MRYLAGKEIKQFIINSGYKTIRLHKDGKAKTFLVQRLVYEAFNGPIPEGMQVNHINEDKTDNRLCNLNLLTSKENNNWGTKPQKTMKHVKELKKRVVCLTKDKKPYMCFPSLTAAAEEFNTTVQNIGYAVKHKKKACKYYWELIP